MGIKAKVIGGIGTIVVGGLATWLGIKKKSGQQLEKVNAMISDVDLKEQEEPEEEEEKQASMEGERKELEDALRKAGLNKEADAYKAACEEIDEIRKKPLFEFRAAGNPEKITPEEWERQKQEKAEKNWKEKVEKAIQNKDFYEMERLFDQKYAGGPWHPSPASVFGDARNDKIITDELYDEAMHFFGKLWNYSGD